MKLVSLLSSITVAAVAAACSSSNASDDPNDVPAPTLRAQVQPVTRAADAKPGVFVPPFVDCRAPKPGESAASSSAPSSDGRVCTNVAISGATEPGRYFPDYAACDVVRTQRPYWPAPPKGSTKEDDPRLRDDAFQRELAWVTQQVASTGCACCHDSRQAPRGPSQWFIDAPGIWTDTVSDAGIALFTGLADSSVLGAYAPEDNHGFERTTTGLPSTDGARMRAFFVAELRRRGISDAQAAAVPPFGGPLYANLTKEPGACAPGEGIDASGRLAWGSPSTARYVYVLDAAAKNPGVPPNLDRPDGTLWRLDVLASADPLASGFPYGATPPGSFQSIPDAGRAPALERGKTYHLFVLRDVGLVVTSCLFTYPASAP